MAARFFRALAPLLVFLVLTPTRAAAEGPLPVVQPFFGPKAANDKQGLYYNLMRFLDSASSSIHGCVHEMDMIRVADKLAQRAREGLDVQIVIESSWWNSAKNKAARQVLEKSQVVVYPDTKKSDLMHNKFFIVDRKRVWTGSTNMTETCLFFNPNNSVWVESTQVAANYLAEFEEERAGKFGKRASKKYKSPFPVVTVGNTRIRTYFGPEDDPLHPVVELIDKAEKSIEVMCYVFSSQKVAEALIRAHQRGVYVRVLLDNLYSHDSTTARWSYVPFKELKKAGIHCKYDNEDSKFHHKVVIVDSKSVVTGSMNLSSAAENRNDENVLIIDSAEVARAYGAEFERWWKYFPGDPGKAPTAERGYDDD